jgi:hypothetical protein
MTDIAAILRMLNATALTLGVAGLIASCGGGGGGGSSSSTSTPDQPTSSATRQVTTSVDPSLSGPMSLAKLSSISAWDSQALGNPLKVVDGVSLTSVVYAVDGNGEIALAAPADGSSTVFSAESTVTSIVRVLVLSGGATNSASDIDSATKSQQGYSAVVGAIAQFIRDGANPLNQPSVTVGLGTLADGVFQALGAKIASVGWSHVTALPVNRASAPWTLFSQGPGKTISLDSANADSIGIRNSSTLFLNVSLLNADQIAVQKSDNKVAAASIQEAFTVGKVSGFSKLPLVKEDAFGVRITSDGPENATRFVMDGLALAIKFDGCQAALTKKLGTKTEMATLVFHPSMDNLWSLIKALVPDLPGLAYDCGIKDFVANNVVQIFKSYTKIVSVTSLAYRMAAWIDFPTAPLEIGVCVNSFGTPVSCVDEIVVDQPPPPMMVGVLYQQMIVKFLHNKKPTTQPPHLTVQYSQEGVATVDLKDPGLFPVRAYALGEVAVTLLDPDTGVSKQIFASGQSGEFEVLQGRFDPTPITVDVGHNTTLKVIEINGNRPLLLPYIYDLFSSAADAMKIGITQAPLNPANVGAPGTLTGLQAGDATLFMTIFDPLGSGTSQPPVKAAVKVTDAGAYHFASNGSGIDDVLILELFDETGTTKIADITNQTFGALHDVPFTATKGQTIRVTAIDHDGGQCYGFAKDLSIVNDVTGAVQVIATARLVCPAPRITPGDYPYMNHVPVVIGI